MWQSASYNMSIKYMDIIKAVLIMEVAKIFETDKGQAVRLPEKFRFNNNEVLIQHLGNAVMLIPKDAAWKTFVEGLDSFSDDFFAEGRGQGAQQEKESSYF